MLNVITRSGDAVAATARGADEGGLWQPTVVSVASAARATARGERGWGMEDLGLVVGDGVVARVHVAAQTMSRGAPVDQMPHAPRDFERTTPHIRRRPFLLHRRSVSIDPVASDSTAREQR